jgi:hypothetical protein
LGESKKIYAPKLDRTIEIGVKIMEFIPHVVEAQYVKDYKIKIKFNDGSLKVVDLRPYLEKGGIFEPLRDEEFFKRFFIDLNTLCWPNGADIAPERLYEIGNLTERGKEDAVIPGSMTF